MTNQQVGQVYSKIINEVCDASQTDFEEGGVDQKTLDLLKTTWQKKLTYLNIAHFPWDPPPVQPAPPPTTQHAPPQPVPSNVPRPPPPQSLPSNGGPAQGSPPMSNAAAPRIKPEPGSYSGPPGPPQPNGYYPQQPGLTMSGANTPQARAAAHLQQKFGSQAAPQIAQLQQQSAAALGLPSQRAQGMPLQGQPPPDQKAPPGMFQPQQPQQQHNSPLGTAQTDGAGDALDDWKAEVDRRRAAAAQGGGKGDSILRDHMLAMAQRMEGGGLMVPLEERYFPGKGTKRKVDNLQSSSSTTPSKPDGPSESEASSIYSALRRAQMDGVDDDEDEDEKPVVDDADAINSDLDDPEDPEGGGEDEDETPQVMLCTYDKVQRVKNKWKCTLKDGILFVNGKEYVFHKGQGEFEW